MANNISRKEYQRNYYKKNRRRILAGMRRDYCDARAAEADTIMEKEKSERDKRLAAIRAENGRRMRKAMGI